MCSEDSQCRGKCDSKRPIVKQTRPTEMLMSHLFRGKICWKKLELLLWNAWQHDLPTLQQQLWWVTSSSRILYCVTGYLVPDVSRERTCLIFKGLTVRTKYCAMQRHIPEEVILHSRHYVNSHNIYAVYNQHWNIMNLHLTTYTN